MDASKFRYLVIDEDGNVVSGTNNVDLADHINENADSRRAIDTKTLYIEETDGDDFGFGEDDD